MTRTLSPVFSVVWKMPISVSDHGQIGLQSIIDELAGEFGVPRNDERVGLRGDPVGDLEVALITGSHRATGSVSA